MNRENAPQFNPLEQAATSKESEFDLLDIEGRIGTILEEFMQQEGISEYHIAEVRRTGKSVFGRVEIEGKGHFFKVSRPENILRELQGYKIAEEYPHEKVYSHHFHENYGIYLQEYCEEITGPEGQMSNQINRTLDLEDGLEMDNLLAKTEKVFATIGEIYEKSITKKPIVMHGPNDNFFHDRIKSNGRVDMFYKNKEFEFPATGERIPFENLLEYTFVINGDVMKHPLRKLIDTSRIDLSPDKERVFILSQGDPTETNMTLSGKFFDFETAGYNSVVQDIAIFVYHNYISGHYLVPKYSMTETLEEMKQRDATEYSKVVKFADGIDVTSKIDKPLQRMDINFNIPRSEIKKRIFLQYLNNVVKRVEQTMSSDMQKKLVHELQSAILLRIIGVKDLRRLDEKDMLLSLALANHFAQPDDDAVSMSDFLQKKLLNNQPNEKSTE